MGLFPISSLVGLSYNAVDSLRDEVTREPEYEQSGADYSNS